MYKTRKYITKSCYTSPPFHFAKKKGLSSSDGPISVLLLTPNRLLLVFLSNSFNNFHYIFIIQTINFLESNKDAIVNQMFLTDGFDGIFKYT